MPDPTSRRSWIRGLLTAATATISVSVANLEFTLPQLEHEPSEDEAGPWLWVWLLSRERDGEQTVAGIETHWRYPFVAFARVPVPTDLMTAGIEEEIADELAEEIEVQILGYEWNVTAELVTGVAAVTDVTVDEGYQVYDRANGSITLRLPGEIRFTQI